MSFSQKQIIDEPITPLACLIGVIGISLIGILGMALVVAGVWLIAV